MALAARLLAVAGCVFFLFFVILVFFLFFLSVSLSVGVLGLGLACCSLFNGNKQRLHNLYLWGPIALGVVARLLFVYNTFAAIYRPFHTVVSALLTTGVKKL